MNTKKLTALFGALTIASISLITPLQSIHREQEIVPAPPFMRGLTPEQERAAELERLNRELIETDNIDTILSLLDQGADIYYQGPLSKANLFHGLCRANKLETLEALFEHCAKHSIDTFTLLQTQDYIGFTPLHYACEASASCAKVIEKNVPQEQFLELITIQNHAEKNPIVHGITLRR